MKRLLVLLTLVALTLSLTACGGTSGTTSGNASKETVQSSTTPAGSENTTPESDPSPESSKQPVADDPAPTSDELPSGYINYAEDASYSIYGQLGDPGDTITTTESDCFIYTIFIPELDIELVTAIDEKNGDYFCLYEYSKLAANAPGIINGVGNNRFDPNGVLTTEQAIVMAQRALEALANS